MSDPSQFFLQHFDRLVEAPDGIAKLRALVLQLAVQGKLLPQNPKDEPASELLQQIEQARSGKSKNAKTTKLELLPSIQPEDFPHELPQGWEWSRLGSLGIIGSSCRVHQKDWTTRGVPFLRAREIVTMSKHGRVDNELFITEEHFQRLTSDGLTPESNDVMITGVGTIGVPYVVKATDRFYFKDASVLIFKNCFGLYPHYVRIVLQSPLGISEAHKESMGTTVHTLTIARANLIPFPLPPLAEQQRIVAKVEELLGLCDALEAAQREREAVRTRLRTSALHQLASPESESDSSSAAFVFKNLQLFTAAPDDFADIRQSVLQFAIEGKLSTQKSDEPGDTLLQQLRKRKLALIASGKAPKEKPAEPIDVSTAPFEIPSSWTWTRVAWISVGLDYGTSEKSERSNSGVPVVSMGNLQNGRILLEGLKRVPDSTEGLPDLYLEAGDILFNRTNSAELVGKTGIFEGESQSFTFASYLIRLRLVTEFVDPRFVIIATNAPYFRATQIAPEIVQQCGQANVNGTKLANFLVPLPPLAEQRRIVAKVDELMVALDALEATLITARTTSERLFAAAIAKLHAA